MSFVQSFQRYPRRGIQDHVNTGLTTVFHCASDQTYRTSARRVPFGARREFLLTATASIAVYVGVARTFIIATRLPIRCIP